MIARDEGEKKKRRKERKVSPRILNRSCKFFSFHGTFSKLFLPARYGKHSYFHTSEHKEARGWQKNLEESVPVVREPISRIYSPRPRDSRKACCTRGHVFEIREIDSSPRVYARVRVRAYVAFVKPGGGRVHSNYSLPMTPGNRVYVASVSTRHCVLYVHPRSSTRTHTRGKDYWNRLCKWTCDNCTNICTREEEDCQNESTRLESNFIRACNRTLNYLINRVHTLYTYSLSEDKDNYNIVYFLIIIREKEEEKKYSRILWWSIWKEGWGGGSLR